VAAQHSITTACTPNRNRRGYELATVFRAKLDYVSPVWYQLRREQVRLRVCVCVCVRILLSTLHMRAMH